MTSIGKNIQMQKEIWSGLKTILRHHGVMSYVADEKNETLFSGSHTAQPSLIRRCCLLAWCSTCFLEYVLFWRWECPHIDLALRPKLVLKKSWAKNCPI